MRRGAGRTPFRVGHTGADPRPDAARGRRLGSTRRRARRRSTGGCSAAIADHRDALADPSGTSIVSAADGDGNAVVVVHSNSYPRYGSGLVVGDYDLVLANRAGRGFTPEPDHPNFPSPGRRPATTLHAWMTTADGGPSFLGGTPGGDNQVVWNAQLLQGIIDGETAPGVLVTAPRWEWLPADDGVRIEAGFDDADAADASSASRRGQYTSGDGGCRAPNR